MPSAGVRALARRTSRADWRAFLPGYLDEGWASNDLDLWGLAEPRRLLGEGKYAEARDLFDRAEPLFTSVGRADRVDRLAPGGSAPSPASKRPT